MVTNTATIPNRDAIEERYTWNDQSVFESPEAWQAEFEALSQAIPEFKQYAGTLHEGPEKLADALESRSQLTRRITKLWVYVGMGFSVNSNDEASKMRMGQLQSLVGRFGQTVAFVEPEMLAIGEDTLRGWLDHEALQPFRQWLADKLRMAQHIRSHEVEEIMGMLSEPMEAVEQIYDMFTDSDMRFEDAVGADGSRHTVSQSSMDMIKGHTDREVRRTGWSNYADGYLSFKNALAATYLASVKKDVFEARVRGFDSSLQAALAPYNIPVEVFHNLIAVFKKNLPVWQRYWDVRRRALGYDQLHPYDIWAPLTHNPPRISYEKAVDMITTGMAPLGEDYVSVLRRGCLEERWVDAMPNLGKRQGAFSDGSYDTYPFIMMSFDGSLGGMSTLAHELGHSMHSYLTRKHQHAIDANYSMFVAEVASNFNQALTRAHLFAANDDRDFQLALIQEAMDNFHRYFFIMPTLARFELEVHERAERGEPLTADILNQLMSSLYAEGYGETMSDDPTRTGITWAQFGHLYVAFYTFQYATGISAAHALAEPILKGDADAVSRYLDFLKMGNRQYPLDALRHAGIDMSTPEPVEKAFAQLSELVDRLESLI